ncbi:MAG: hypothetical protein JXQ91_14285 [Vannielia sp.]|uniref:hypothetical protein n=1 Tax=Rhodobacterales TaxID=204455 RepID=UPI0020942D3D|nr:hypothetical protein [Oceanicola sp. 502str15]MCO6383054.1 hypothetical protein [Oceanicola sp. 502str15]
MVEFTREELDAFLSKTDFDFSQTSDWEEFLAERRSGGAGRDADGIQLRDIKNYAVGTAPIFSTGNPVEARFDIRGLGVNNMATGVLYIYYPDAGWNMQVESVFLGQTRHIRHSLDVGGGGTPTRPIWGSLYYIAVKSGDLPGQGAAEALGRRALKEAVRSGGWLLRRGFGLIARGGAGFDVTVRVGAGPEMRNTYLEQEILSDEGWDAVRETAEDAWDYLRE